MTSGYPLNRPPGQADPQTVAESKEEGLESLGCRREGYSDCVSCFEIFMNIIYIYIHIMHVCLNKNHTVQKCSDTVTHVDPLFSGVCVRVSNAA